MSTMARPPKDGEPCPDPSAHSGKATKSANRAPHLASASESSFASSHSPLGPDGKLSAASAATSLKYARPQDLPSFPSHGLDMGRGYQAMGASDGSQKSFDPELSASASKAALLAQKKGGKFDLWQPKASSTGNYAAGLAMNKGNTMSPQLDYGYTEEGHKKALLAATLSVRSRPATKSSEGLGSAIEASRIQNASNIPREMYTEHPPVAIELEEQRKKDALRASAISMAKMLYNIEAKRSDSLKAPTAGTGRKASREGPPTDSKSMAMGYVGLQEAAQKLASERLAKLDPDGVMAYREHYGYGLNPNPTSPYRNRKGVPVRTGDKPKMDNTFADFDSDDEAQARKIRGQMRGLNSDLASVDATKRDTDRANLMAAAQKLVAARMAVMDEQVFADTGKMTPAVKADWEAKARAKASADSDERMLTHGKVHIGKGKYMDISEIDAIARVRMQPTLDELDENAQKARERDEEIRQAQAERKAQLAEQRAEQQREKAEQAKERAAVRAEQQKEKEAIKLKLATEKKERDMAKAQEKAERREIVEAQREKDRQWKAEQREAARLGAFGVQSKQPSEVPGENAAEEAADVAPDELAAEEGDGHSIEPENEDFEAFSEGEATEKAEEPVAVTTLAEGELAEPEIAGESSAMAETETIVPIKIESATEAEAPSLVSREATGEESAEVETALGEEEIGTTSSEMTPITQKTSRRKTFFGKFSKRFSRSEKGAKSEETSSTIPVVPAVPVSGPGIVGQEAEDGEDIDEPVTGADAHDVAARVMSAPDDGLYSEPSEGTGAVAEATEAHAVVAGDIKATDTTAAATGHRSTSSLSSIYDEEEPRGRKSDVTESDAPFVEANDTFEDETGEHVSDLEAPKASYSRESNGGSPARSASKFQEEL